MAPQLLKVLQETMLPMAERLSLEKLVIPDDAGKASFAPYRGKENNRDDARGAFEPDELKRYAYEGHAALEMIAVFSGNAELALGGRRYMLAEGDWVVIPPHVLHKERLSPDRHAYHLVWMRYTPHRLTLHSSSYNRGNRFQLVRGAGLTPTRELKSSLDHLAEEIEQRPNAWFSRLRVPVSGASKSVSCAGRSPRMLVQPTPIKRTGSLSAARESRPRASREMRSPSSVGSARVMRRVCSG